MSSRTLLTLAVVWSTLCGAMFVTLFSWDVTDDVAGFVIAMLVLQLAPALALARAPEGVPLSAGRSVAVAIPSAIVGAFTSFFVFGSLFSTLIKGLDLVPLLAAFVAALAGCLGAGLFVGLYLPRRLHPAGARHVLGVLTIVNTCGGVLVLLIAQRADAALAVVMSTPAAWCIPLWLLTLRRAADPVPPAIARTR